MKNTIVFCLSALYLYSINLLAMQPIGWIENIRFQEHDFAVTAKIDTGADHSSLDSTDWRSFQKDNFEWIRFTLRNNQGESQVFEKPLERYAEIKRKKAEPVKRPVIEMDLCLAGKNITVPVNLADRGNFHYRMLIGRSALAGQYLVDSSATYTTDPVCSEAR